IVSHSGVTVYLDAPVTVPAANPVAGTFGKATGTATTSITGPAANIPAQGINTSGSGNAVNIINYTAFTGGQNSAHYKYVQQSDVTNTTLPLEDSLQQEGQSKLRAQVGPQQALVGSIRCVPTVNSDHPIGDAGINVLQVT